MWRTEGCYSPSLLHIYAFPYITYCLHWAISCTESLNLLQHGSSCKNICSNEGCYLYVLSFLSVCWCKCVCIVKILCLQKFCLFNCKQDWKKLFFTELLESYCSWWSMTIPRLFTDSGPLQLKIKHQRIKFSIYWYWICRLMPAQIIGHSCVCS